MPSWHAEKMELRQLRYLREVGLAGSISRAAENLCIAQSAVSRQIADLEAELNTTLLRRERGGGALTEAGQRFVDGATEILASLDALRASVSATPAEPQMLRVGLPPTVSPILLDLMTRSLPDSELPVRPSVVEASSYWLRHRLDNNDLDCAILTNPKKSRSLHVEPLWQESLFLVGKRSAPVMSRSAMTLRDLPALPLTLTPRGDPSREAIENAFSAQGLVLSVAYEHEALTLLRGLLAKGESYSILSRTVASTLLEADGLAAVPISGLSINRSLVVRKGALPRDLVERLAFRIRAAGVKFFA
ncbi:LysR family transcriptional regulator [Ottowia sp. VDI28]|uniref:LysR family transcriptional regulator n=1 Tax=Ottowia sp. VDI28 TaxID=3133968 RepID=UPI003C2E985C